MRAKAAETTPGAETEHASDAAEELAPNLAALLEVAPTAVTEPVTTISAEGFGGLGLGLLVDQLEDGSMQLKIRGTMVLATCSPTLHPSVLTTAMERGEPVLVEREDDGRVVVVGALRTQPTPGIDQMEEIHLEADRIHLRGNKEVTLSTSGVATLAVRAIGEVETYANRIVSRAEEVHKIVGRMLRLN